MLVVHVIANINFHANTILSCEDRSMEKFYNTLNFSFLLDSNEWRNIRSRNACFFRDEDHNRMHWRFLYYSHEYPDSKSVLRVL